MSKQDISGRILTLVQSHKELHQDSLAQQITQDNKPGQYIPLREVYQCVKELMNDCKLTYSHDLNGRYIFRS
jgi:hypothetical protein